MSGRRDMKLEWQWLTGRNDFVVGNLKTKLIHEAEKIFSSQPLLKTSSFKKTKLHGHAYERCRSVLRPPNHLLDHAIGILEAINWSLLALIRSNTSTLVTDITNGKGKNQLTSERMRLVLKPRWQPCVIPGIIYSYIVTHEAKAWNQGPCCISCRHDIYFSLAR